MHRDSVVRTKLGMPMSTAAQLAGVCRSTLRIYESSPEAIGEAARARCQELYAAMRDLLARAPGLKGW